MLFLLDGAGGGIGSYGTEEGGPSRGERGGGGGDHRSGGGGGRGVRGLLLWLSVAGKLLGLAPLCSGLGLDTVLKLHVLVKKKKLLLLLLLLLLLGGD